MDELDDQLHVFTTMETDFTIFLGKSCLLGLQSVHFVAA